MISFPCNAGFTSASNRKILILYFPFGQPLRGQFDQILQLSRTIRQLSVSGNSDLLLLFNVFMYLIGYKLPFLPIDVNLKF